MKQYDVFENPNAKAKRATPYVVVLQSEAATGQWTTIAAPLAKKSDVPTSDRIVIPVEANGQSLVLLLQSMAAVEKRLLSTPIATVAEQLRDKLPRAIDYLFLGF